MYLNATFLIQSEECTYLENPWRILNKCFLINNYTSLFTMALKKKFNGVDFWFKLWIDVIILWIDVMTLCSLKHFVIYEYFYRFPCTFRFSMTLILWSGRFCHCVRVKFIYSEKATTFYKTFTLLLSYVVPVKRKVKISKNFVAFSEYMNFKV